MKIILAIVAILMTIVAVVVTLVALFTGWISLMWIISSPPIYYPHKFELEHYILAFVGMALASAVLVVIAFKAWVIFLTSVEGDGEKDSDKPETS